MNHNINEILFCEETIRRRVDELAGKIAADSVGKNLIILGILNGSFIFLADLVRAFAKHQLHPRIDFITLSSYGAGTESSGTVKLTHDTSIDLCGADVIVVDDILDSGRTLRFAKELFLERGARTVKTCVMLDKKARRAVDMNADYAGFTVDDVFVVGYGLDCNGLYRELPHIAKIEFGV